MKRLILMRHAKSDWTGGAMNDHDRPLNPRGRKAAAALGTWLKDKNLIPDQVLSSSAIRTRETFVRLNLPEPIPSTFTRDLYLASDQSILTSLRQATGTTVLMLGHNPGIGSFAEEILGDPPNHLSFAQYPTGATLVATFDIKTWGEAHWANAQAQHFTVPRDL